MVASIARIAIDCYVRASPPAEVSEIVGSLHAYESDPAVTDLEITVWPDHVSLTGNTGVEAITEDYDRFLRWAERENVSLAPAFSLRSRSDLVCNRRESVLTLPVICLVVRMHGDIVALAPHTTRRGTYTVADVMADIEAHLQVSDSLESIKFPSGPSTSPPSDPKSSEILHPDR